MKILLDALKIAGENFEHSFTVADLNLDDQALVYINKKFLTETGHQLEDILFKNCRFLQGQETDSEITKHIRSKIDARLPCYADLINYKKNGEKFFNRLLLIPVGTKKDQVRYYIGIQLDITNTKTIHSKQKIYNLEDKSEQLSLDLNSIINFYRSLEYFDNFDQNNAKFQELMKSTKIKIQNICNFVKSQ